MNKGYTLLEILVIMMIIGIMCGLVIPAVVAYRARGGVKIEREVDMDAEEALRGQNISVKLMLETNGLKVYRFYDRQINDFGYFSIENKH